MKNKLSTAVTLGFALFAMFFGAGNLILPPFIGLKTGTEWFAAIAGFFTTGIVSPFLGTHIATDYGFNTLWIITTVILVIVAIGYHFFTKPLLPKNI